MTKWVTYCNNVVMDLESVIKKLGSKMCWTGKFLKLNGGQNPGVIKGYLEELVESIKNIRTGGGSPKERYDIVNRSYSKINFLKGNLQRTDFGEDQTMKENVLERIVRAETTLSALRDLAKEEMAQE